MEQEHIKEALRWIAGILGGRNIPFQIVGGLAANAWGSKRELNDIDIIIPESAFKYITSDVKGHIKEGPDYYKKDAHWSNYAYMELEFEGVTIEIASAENTKIFNRRTKKWSKWKVDFSKSVVKRIYGLSIPVMSLANLIDYKKKLNRPVDKEDIAQIQKI